MRCGMRPVTRLEWAQFRLIKQNLFCHTACYENLRVNCRLPETWNNFSERRAEKRSAFRLEPPPAVLQSVRRPAGRGGEAKRRRGLPSPTLALVSHCDLTTAPPSLGARRYRPATPPGRARSPSTGERKNEANPPGVPRDHASLG